MTQDRSHATEAPLGADTTSAVAVWHMVRKYWPTAVGAFALVLLTTIFFTLGQTKIYQAETIVHFDPNPPRPLGNRVESVVDMGAGNFWGNQEYYETQYNIIRSRQVSLLVVKELGLHHDRAFIQNLPPGEEPETTDAAPISDEQTADILRARLTVEAVRDSRLARITIKDADPERAQRVLTTLVEVYIRRNLDSAVDSTGAATDWLRNQLDTLKKELDSSELDLHKYKKENDILSLAFDDQSNMLSEEIKHLNAELTQVKAALQGATAKSSVLNAAPENDATLIQASELLQSPLLTTLRSEYERAIRDRDALLGTRRGPNHPDVAAAEGRVRASEAAILKEIKNVKRAVARDVAVLSRHAGGLQSMLDQTRERAHEFNLLEIEYNRLRRSKDNTEKLYAMVLERTKEADLAQMMRVNNISVVDWPVIPTVPVQPKVPLNLAVGSFLGIVLGLASAFLRGLLDRTIKVPEDIEIDMGATFLGLLPQVNEKPSTRRGSKRRRGRPVIEGEPELIVHDQPTSTIAEASRAIRTNLMFMTPDDPHRSLLITSAGPSEGKTTIACCIAIAMAQAGQRVVLIDCDLRRPRIHRVFGASGSVGVTTALLDGDIDACIQATRVENLSIIASGPIPPNPAELLHAARFRELLHALTSRFDRVIIDSPPVGVVTDPAILSTLADGTVLVVRAFKTRKDLGRHALRAIGDVGGNLAGAVLNAVDFSRSEYKNSYYYYRHDEYYGETADDARRDRDPPAKDQRPPAPPA